MRRETLVQLLVQHRAAHLRALDHIARAPAIGAIGIGGPPRRERRGPGRHGIARRGGQVRVDQRAPVDRRHGRRMRGEAVAACGQPGLERRQPGTQHQQVGKVIGKRGGRRRERHQAVQQLMLLAGGLAQPRQHRRRGLRGGRCRAPGHGGGRRRLVGIGRSNLVQHRNGFLGWLRRARQEGGGSCRSGAGSSRHRQQFRDYRMTAASAHAF